MLRISYNIIMLATLIAGVLFVSGAATGCAGTSEVAVNGASGNKNADLWLNLRDTGRTSGQHYGLVAPVLQLVLKNHTESAILVPAGGLPLLQSIRVLLFSPTGTIVRRPANPGKAAIEHVPLGPGERRVVDFSLLASGPGEIRLPPADYKVRVCISIPAEMQGPSVFAETYGGACTDVVPATISRLGKTP
ncbi:MAG: hypothetical protein HUU55_22315 [Myxococcales bacterium]|nr:hypothetical protein [Myxococcales bacterium]